MSRITVSVEPHPLLELAVFSIAHNESRVKTSDDLRLLSLEQDAVEQSPFDIHADEFEYAKVKSAVRNVLRHGGYKPTGRGKPASEYLVKAVRENKLGSINPIVDTLNAVSLHSGLPISVVDLSKCAGAENGLSVGIAPVDSAYEFNASGQTIKLDGLLCLFDQQGPCANAVKDSQRTKTDDSTGQSLVAIWGTKDLPEHSAKTETWFRELVESQSIGETIDVTLQY